MMLRFRRQNGEKLKRFCIIEWRRAVERRSRMSQITERACVLRRFILERRSFHLWQSATRYQELIRKAFQRTRHMVESSWARRVLSALLAFCRSKSLERRQLVTAENFWRWNAIKRCSSSWYHYVHEKQMQQRADHKWSDYRLRLVMSGWKDAISVDSASQDPVLHIRLLTKWFWCWNLLVSQKKARRDKYGDEDLVVAERHYQRKLLRSAYDRWHKESSGRCSARVVNERSLESDAMEVAESWFVRSFVKRCLLLWKRQAAMQKNRRRNHWQAVVHSKMRHKAEGFRALCENVDIKHFKDKLRKISTDCYQHKLKRKAVNGYKLHMETTRLMDAQVEHAKARWRAAKLQELFQKWYFATALRSLKRSLLQKSVNFSITQLLLRTFQAWRSVKGVFKDRKSLKMARLNSVKGTIGKLKKSQIFSSWKSLRKEMTIKRFNEARALQFFIGFRATAVVKALHVNMQEQKLKRSLLAKAAHFQKTNLFRWSMSKWSEFVWLKQLDGLATDHRRRRLLKQALQTLLDWREPPTGSDIQEDDILPKSPCIQRISLGVGTHPISGPAPPKPYAVAKFPAQMCEQNATTSVRPVLPMRSQPRRPAFLYENGNLTRSCRSSLPNLDENMKSSPTLTMRDPNMVAKEVDWMEQILLDYEEMKVQIVQLRAELALQLDTSGAINSIDPLDQQNKMLHDQKLLLLQQDLHSLEAKKMVQMPLIQAVLSRVQDLRASRIPN